MIKIIITTGNTHVDIDALACALAYKDFLRGKDVLCEVVFSAPLNETISKTIKSWELDYKANVDNTNKDDLNFVVVDCANTKVLPEFVDLNKTIEVYDHHSLNDNNLWKDTDANVDIELVGACATLIWEKIKSENLESHISKTSIDLLLTAIFANTLNFKSSVTTDRDKNAYTELKRLSNLGDNWVSLYYQEIEESILKDPETAIMNDTKVVDFTNLSLKIAIGQIELWNSKKFINDNKEIITKTLTSFGVEDWFLTSPSISEGKNYIYTQSQKVIKILENNFGARFNGNNGVTDKLWLRKEILRKLLSI